MLIDRIFNKVKTYLNTDGRGNFSPSDFNLFLHDAIQNRIEEYFPDLDRAVNRQNRGLVSNYLDNLPERLREKLLYYLKSSALPRTDDYTRSIPSDVRYIDEIETDATEISFEPCESKKEYNILKPNATIQYPISYRIGNNIKIYPAYADAMTVTYLRTIKYPKWTYVKDGNGNEFFNPSATDFQDADIHPSEEDEMVVRVLKRFGINLKETDITNFTMNEEKTEFNETNQT